MSAATVAGIAGGSCWRAIRRREGVQGSSRTPREIDGTTAATRLSHDVVARRYVDLGGVRRVCSGRSNTTSATSAERSRCAAIPSVRGAPWLCCRGPRPQRDLPPGTTYGDRRIAANGPSRTCNATSSGLSDCDLQDGASNEGQPVSDDEKPRPPATTTTASRASTPSAATTATCHVSVRAEARRHRPVPRPCRAGHIDHAIRHHAGAPDELDHVLAQGWRRLAGQGCIHGRHVRPPRPRGPASGRWRRSPRRPPRPSRPRC